MKARVISKLNKRLWPSTKNTPLPNPLNPNDIIEVVEEVDGEAVIPANNKWSKTDKGFYVWSGGILKESADIALSSNQYWLNQYGIQDIWKRGITGKGVKIAILDTGVAYPHPDLKLNPEMFHDVTGSQTGVKDLDGHGTHCVGIICGGTSNRPYGVAYDASIYVCKVTHDLAGDDDYFLKKAVDWAVEQKVDIISISKGQPNENSELEKSLEIALKDKILVVASAGNIIAGLPSNNIYYPARYKSVLSVGGLDYIQKPLEDSILSGETNLFGPGKNILSSDINLGRKIRSGSSQAAPFVAGVCALLLQQSRVLNQPIDPIEIKSILIRNSSHSKKINILKLNNLFK
jgi:subtilisin family serine protease